RDSRFSLPSNRYFSRHHFPPVGETSRYSPPPSNSLMGFSPGLALRIAVSVNGMGATSCGATHLSPMLPPSAPGCQWKVLSLAGRKTKEKAPSYTGFGMLLELLGWLSGGAEGNRT